MALLLNIETSTTVCSVCLARDGQVIDFREDKQGTSHARVLTVFIDELLKANHFSAQQLDAVAVSSGPGSYTGLRIGTSVAKGLCYALNKPLIAIPTLLSLALGIMHKVKNENAFYMPVLDARRMDVYTAIYDVNANEVKSASAPTLDKPMEELIIQFGDIYIGGNATEKCRNIFTSPMIHFVEQVDCDSRLMASLAEAKFSKSEFENTAYFEPFYLKDFGQKN